MAAASGNFALLASERVTVALWRKDDILDGSGSMLEA
jgi:hypothetical protein